MAESRKRRRTSVEIIVKHADDNQGSFVVQTNEGDQEQSQDDSLTNSEIDDDLTSAIAAEEIYAAAQPPEGDDHDDDGETTSPEPTSSWSLAYSAIWVVKVRGLMRKRELLDSAVSETCAEVLGEDIAHGTKPHSAMDSGGAFDSVDYADENDNDIDDESDDDDDDIDLDGDGDGGPVAESPAYTEATRETRRSRPSGIRTFVEHRAAQSNLLRNHPSVLAAISDLWMLEDIQADLDKDNTLGKDVYISLLVKFQYLIVPPPLKASKALENAEIDFHNDSRGSANNRMTRAMFEDAMFELADTWSSEADANEYVQILKHLLQGVSVVANGDYEASSSSDESEDSAGSIESAYNNTEHGWNDGQLSNGAEEPSNFRSERRSETDLADTQRTIGMAEQAGTFELKVVAAAPGKSANTSLSQTRDLPTSAGELVSVSSSRGQDDKEAHSQTTTLQDEISVPPKDSTGQESCFSAGTRHESDQNARQVTSVGQTSHNEPFPGQDQGSRQDECILPGPQQSGKACTLSSKTQSCQNDQAPTTSVGAVGLLESALSFQSSSCCENVRADPGIQGGGVHSETRFGHEAAQGPEMEGGPEQQSAAFDDNREMREQDRGSVRAPGKPSAQIQDGTHIRKRRGHRRRGGKRAKNKIRNKVVRRCLIKNNKDIKYNPVFAKMAQHKFEGFKTLLDSRLKVKKSGLLTRANARAAIGRLYQAKYMSDLKNRSKGLPLPRFDKFVFEQHVMQFGSRKMAKRNLKRLFNTVRCFANKGDPVMRMFALLCGLEVAPTQHDVCLAQYDPHLASDYYLPTLVRILDGDSKLAQVFTPSRAPGRSATAANPSGAEGFLTLALTFQLTTANVCRHTPPESSVLSGLIRGLKKLRGHVQDEIASSSAKSKRYRQGRNLMMRMNGSLLEALGQRGLFTSLDQGLLVDVHQAMLYALPVWAADRKWSTLYRYVLAGKAVARWREMAKMSVPPHIRILSQTHLRGVRVAYDNFHAVVAMKSSASVIEGLSGEDIWDFISAGSREQEQSGGRGTHETLPTSARRGSDAQQAAPPKLFVDSPRTPRRVIEEARRLDAALHPPPGPSSCAT